MSPRTHVSALPPCLLAIVAAGFTAAMAGCAADAPTALEVGALSADRGVQNGCSNVSGSDIAQFTSPTTGVGTFTGDISGTGDALVDELRPSGDGALHLAAHGTITTTSGDQIFTTLDAVLAPADPPSYRGNGAFTLIGGTGTYANVSGVLDVHGDVNLGTGAANLLYNGRVCLGS
jgi:hypothetical protein